MSEPGNPIRLATYWTVRLAPPHRAPSLTQTRLAPPPSGPIADPNPSRPIFIQPSHAFGDGTHPTTQLCLLALGYLARTGFSPGRALDFGAGSGILSIAAALLGAQCDAVENEPLALGQIQRNGTLNGVANRIDSRPTLPSPGMEYDLVMANILGPVLLAHADPLCARQARHGWMILSGLLATDVPSILARFQPRLPPMVAQIHQRGPWRAVLFGPS